MSTPPVWENYMAPALRVLSDGVVRKSRDIVEDAADLLGVSAEQRAALIDSGLPRYLNRGNWALSYLKRAGAVDRPARGHYVITQQGRDLLAALPGGITERDLRAVPGYVSPRGEGRATTTPEAALAAPEPTDEPTLSPTEQIEDGVARLHAAVAADLLDRLHAQSPAFFEQAVLDLLMAMGYGGTEGRATRTQLSNDGGIDGIIDQDALGLSRVYVQAKRYGLDSSVGSPEIQGFVGALHGNQANQGVFITTASFSKKARDYASNVATRVVLIDGSRLAALMIRYGVGVQVRRTVNIVEIDEDFFEQPY